MGVVEDLHLLSDHKRAEINKSFFKTGKGEYGEGDVFIGVTVPEIRKVAKSYKSLSYQELTKLLHDGIHEIRLCALLILVDKFKEDPQKVYEIYLNNTRLINNWDLVDVTAHLIVGAYLDGKDLSVLFRLAKSGNLWERRISVIATQHFIRRNKFEPTLNIAEILLHDHHDLIHKAVGWMLREVGKKDKSVLEGFLEKHSKIMPRTMLRYAIEKFSVKERSFWLAKSPRH